MFVKKVKSMTTFREFLLSRNVINEDIDKDWEDAKNDPRNKALEEFQKTEGAPTGLNSDDEEDALVKINDIVADKGGEEFESWKDVIKAWEDYNNKKKAYDTDNGDISDVEDDEKAAYIISALKNRMGEAVKFNDETAASVAKALIDADDGNGKIVKKEFLDAIKNIKGKVNDASIGNKLNNLAALLYFVYLTKTMKGVKGANIISKDGTIINRGGGLDKQGIDGNALKELNKRLGHFKKLNFDSDILSIFKTPKATIALMNSIKPGEEIDETQFDKIKDKFVLKRTEIKQAEKEADEAEEAKTKTDEKIEELKQQKEDLTKENKTGREEAVSKKKFYIFDVDIPDPGDSREKLEEWFGNMENPKYAGGVMGMIQKIRDELKEYKPKPNENDLNETVAKIFKKNGLIFESYEKTSSEINKLIDEAEPKITKYLDGARNKAMSLQGKIEANASYAATVELRRQFKQLFIDLGYLLSQEVRALVRATNLKMNSLKNAKRRETFDSYKTTEQRGQEELDSRNIIKVINGVGVSRDDQHIARFMLINLLNSETSSSKILEYLNSKGFGDNKRYVYSGTSKLIYALSKNDIGVEELGNGITLYNFKRARARVYKNPTDLIETAIGIKISTLTPDVLKTVKKEAAARAEEAKKYLDSANAIADMVAKLGGIPLTEGIMDFIRTKDTTKNSDFKELNTTLANKEQKQGATDIMGAIQNCSYEINLDKEFQPQGNGPEDIALRQIFKGFCLIDANGKRYVSTYDAVKKGIAAAEAAKRHQESEAMKQAQGNAEKHYVDAHNSPEVSSTTSSVVTSTNADSTYGDGYGYSKKADAIKKKLNSTTYTYMPNSKMRIVRRTFD